MFDVVEKSNTGVWAVYLWEGSVQYTVYGGFVDYDCIVFL